MQEFNDQNVQVEEQTHVVKEIKQYQKKWLQHVQRMDTDYQNKHYNINQMDEGTLDDRGRDGGINFILRIKEQETRLALQEHDDDDDDDDDDEKKKKKNRHDAHKMASL